jgi:hypothetical protein
MIQSSCLILLVALIPVFNVSSVEAAGPGAGQQSSPTVILTGSEHVSVASPVQIAAVPVTQGLQIKVKISEKTFSKTTMASEGSSGRGGGDIEQLRNDEIEPYVNGGLKNDVIQYLTNLSSNQVPDALLAQIGALQSGIADDIQSHYILSDHCYDKYRIERSAATSQGIRRADICFNLSRLSSLNVNRNELLALAVHEHSRHFGFEDDASADQDNPIYQFVTQNLTSLNGREAVLSYVLSSPEYRKMMDGDLSGVAFPWADSQMGGWYVTPQGEQCYMDHKLTMTFALTSSESVKFDVLVSSVFSPGTDCNDQHLISRVIKFSRSN